MTLPEFLFTTKHHLSPYLNTLQVLKQRKRQMDTEADTPGKIEELHIITKCFNNAKKSIHKIMETNTYEGKPYKDYVPNHYTEITDISL